MNLRNYYMFEDCVAKIFIEAGYSVTQNIRLGKKDEIDIVIQKKSKKICVEVKYTKVLEQAIERICVIAESYEMIPALVTATYIEEKKREYYQKKFPKLLLLDIANLLYAVQGNTELQNELLALLSYTIDDIKPQEGFIKIESLRHDDYTNSLIREMNLCETGKPMSRTYEVLCHKFLENIFSDDLTLWREQQKSNKDLYRFDLLCRIKDGNKKSFWSIIERYFNSKYVIFEFKNYSNPITQKEIYTTEKYLYSKALRSVGIMISAKGYEENASWAAKGCLRESGKLIILLETNDLIEMNKMKIDQEDPSNYLLEKLDGILLDLEK